MANPPADAIPGAIMHDNQTESYYIVSGGEANLPLTFEMSFITRLPSQESDSFQIECRPHCVPRYPCVDAPLNSHIENSR